MATFISTIVFLSILIIMMSIGIIFSNKSLHGSCGNTCDCSNILKNICPIRKIKDIQSNDK